MQLKRAVMFSFVFITVFSINAVANDNSGVSEKENSEALANDLKLLEDAAINANKKDFERSLQITTEGMAFIEYLRCCSKALPIPPSGRKQFWSKHIPPSNMLRLNYPLKMKVYFEPNDVNDNRTTLIIEKESLTSDWKLTESWLESEEGKPLRKITLPTNEQQKKANEELPRLMSKDSVCMESKEQTTGCEDRCNSLEK